MSGVARCGRCRAFVQQGDRFCWSCGAELTAPPPPPPAAARYESEPEVELALRRAYLARRRGDTAAALRLVRGAVARDPDDPAALSLLSELLRARGDLVGAVEAAQRAARAAPEAGGPRGAVEAARRERAEIEQTVVAEITGAPRERRAGPFSQLLSPGEEWWRRPGWRLALATAGLGATFLAVVAALRGHAAGRLWLGAGLLSAGWCYRDAETRREPGLLWGLVVLCLGPFGLAVYLLARV